MKALSASQRGERYLTSESARCLARYVFPLAAVALVLAVASPVGAQQPTTAKAGPAAASAPVVAAAPAAEPVEALKVIVESVTGVAEKCLPPEKDKWTPVKANDKLDELTIIRTGLRTKVVLKFADRSKMTIGPGSKVGIAEFSKRGRMVTANLGMKYGSLRVSVDHTRGPSDVSISLPVATLSVRGTEGDIAYTGDRGLGLRGRRGTWRVATGPRTRNVTPGESTNEELTPSILLKKRYRSTHLGDAFGGLTNAEKLSQELNPDSRDPSGSSVGRSSGGGTPADITPPVPPEIIRPPRGHIVVGI